MLWNSIYETGNEMVDNDHKEIFGMVEKLLADGGFIINAEELKPSIDFLVNYVAQHFAREEQLMDESGYPNTDIHKKQHSDFAATVAQFVARTEEEFETLDFSLELNGVVVDWIATHVIEADKDMAEHYREWSEKQKS